MSPSVSRSTNYFPTLPTWFSIPLPGVSADVCVCVFVNRIWRTSADISLGECFPFRTLIERYLLYCAVMGVQSFQCTSVATRRGSLKLERQKGGQGRVRWDDLHPFASFDGFAQVKIVNGRWCYDFFLEVWTQTIRDLKKIASRLLYIMEKYHYLLHFNVLINTISLIK